MNRTLIITVILVLAGLVLRVVQTCDERFLYLANCDACIAETEFLLYNLDAPDQRSIEPSVLCAAALRSHITTEQARALSDREYSGQAEITAVHAACFARLQLDKMEENIVCLKVPWYSYPIIDKFRDALKDIRELLYTMNQCPNCPTRVTWNQGYEQYKKAFVYSSPIL